MTTQDATVDEEVWASLEPRISFLVKSTNDFIVFIDKENDLDWSWTTSYNASINQSEFGAVSNRTAAMRALPLAYLGEQNHRSALIMMGEAMSRMLENNPTAAHAMLDHAQKFISARLREIARNWYLTGAAVGTAAIMVLLAPLMWLLNKLFGLSGQAIQDLATGVLAGTVGGLLSIVLRSGAAKFNGSAGRKVHWLDGLIRVSVGSMGGALVVLAVRGGLILPSLSGTAGLALLGISGGFSERWVPSLIEKVEVALLNAKGEVEEDSAASTSEP